MPQPGKIASFPASVREGLDQCLSGKEAEKEKNSRYYALLHVATFRGSVALRRASSRIEKLPRQRLSAFRARVYGLVTLILRKRTALARMADVSRTVTLSSGEPARETSMAFAVKTILEPA